VQIQAPGFATDTRGEVKLGAGASLRLDTKLDLGRPEWNVLVTAAGTPRPAQAPATSEVHGRIRVGGNIQYPKLIQRTDPVYPEPARAQGIEGSIVVSAVIGTIGNVVSAQVANRSAPPELAEAALEAVRTWQYEPALLNGEPVEVVTEITLNFRLR